MKNKEDLRNTVYICIFEYNVGFVIVNFDIQFDNFINSPAISETVLYILCIAIMVFS